MKNIGGIKGGVAAACIVLASLGVAGIGASPAGAASNSKFCQDYKHDNSVEGNLSNKKKLSQAVPLLKKLAPEAPASMRGELSKLASDLQKLAKAGGFTSKSEESSFESLADKLGNQTNKYCK